MKWGRRKSDKTSGAKKNGTVDKVKTRLKEEVGSLKREQQWRKVARNVDKMSTKEINKVAQRIQLENELKRLSKQNSSLKNTVKRIAGDKTQPTDKDRQDYRRRGNMSDQELARKVARLRAKDNLSRAISQASKEQIEFGKSVVNAYKGSSLRDSVEKVAKQQVREATLRNAGFERINR